MASTTRSYQAACTMAETALLTIKSGLPSPSRSPNAVKIGPFAAGRSTRGAKLEGPMFAPLPLKVG